MALRLLFVPARKFLPLATGQALRQSSIAESTAQSCTQDWEYCTTQISQPHGCRGFSTVEAAQSQIDEVNDLFAEARDIIEDARDDAETVYFNDAHAEAKDAVGDCLGKYKAIINSLSADEKGKLQRSMGLKIEQLKAELEELDHLHA